MNEKIKIKVEPELRDYLPKYLESRKKDLERLRDSLSKQDFKTLETISHKIRGHALSYGFVPLSGICALIERAAIEKNYEVIVSQLNEYRDYIEKVEVN